MRTVGSIQRKAGHACMHAGTALILAFQLGFCQPAVAQPLTPSSQEMVEKLRQQPRTRSMRNLIVEPASPASTGNEATAGQQESAAARPSLSLQIQFEFDSAQVRPESQPALQNLARALQTSELSGSRFAVEGHTDARGRPEYNLQLSRRRAESVRHVLAQYGANPAQLLTEGKGSREPANPADPYAPENRRVRIVNLD